MSDKFLQLVRNEKTLWLIEHFPNCFLLLTIIALQARRYPDKNDGLDIGDAIIGELETSKKAGLSRKAYRTALDKLEELNFIETVYNPEWKSKLYLANCKKIGIPPKCQKRATKRAIKSKVVCLINLEVYDINSEDRGEQKGEQGASKGRQTKNEKNEEESTFHLNKEMKCNKSKKIVSFPDTRDQEEFETIMAYTEAQGIPIASHVLKRWIEKNGIGVVNDTITDFLNKANKDTYNGKHESWMESTLKGKWNVLQNRKFIEEFKNEKKWTSLTITKNYCREEKTHNDYKFSLNHETFKQLIETKFEQIQGAGYENY